VSFVCSTILNLRLGLFQNETSISSLFKILELVPNPEHRPAKNILPPNTPNKVITIGPEIKKPKWFRFGSQLHRVLTRLGA
jgi:hypothetical protein